MNDRELELHKRRLRESERWWKSLSYAEKQRIKKDTTGDTPTNLDLLARGLIERCEESPSGFVITPAGELYLHQLHLVKWIEKRREKENPPPPSQPEKPRKKYYGGLK